MLHFIQIEDAVEKDRLFQHARETCRQYYGDKIYFRGLIEFSSYCARNCSYCGLRASNRALARYRLTDEEILDCCAQGSALGYQTFVLQSGEDPHYTDERIVSIVSRIRRAFPQHAITLSLGEKSRESYEAFFRAGANRYLLRHETANEEHYRRLHPASMSLAARKQCLFTLKEIGYQVGAGFMVGSPFQTPEALLEDLRFLQELQPHMIGVGPFIPQSDTPLKAYPAGTLDMTLKMVALCRLIAPAALIPATTALGTISPFGREKGLAAGANVVMPNLSPKGVRKQYALYDNKICTGDEAAECRRCLENRLRVAGFTPDFSRGDHAEWNQESHSCKTAPICL
ncbi:MAG: [FeFe] hydrogenase H-cluster radical SAM maturase HydE [Clostridiales bacterium]|nr:[FeFe] hydrogenase H-cluster radical SAM maturase HydE [Clostridiales bacterium]